MSYKILLIAALCGCLLLFGQLTSAQEVVDRIAAVVGNQIILESELETQVQIYLTQSGVTNPTQQDFNRLKQDILEQMINDRLILVQAEKDTSLRVGPIEIENALDQHLERLKSQFGSEEEFIKQLEKENLTLKDLKRRYKQEVRNQLLKDRLVQKRVAKVNVSTKAVKDFYEMYKDSLPEQPQSVHLAHILLTVQLSQSTLDSLKIKLENIRKEATSGTDFATLAAKYSEDPTAKTGGDLGFFQKGELDPEFEKAAFGLKVGEISGVVQSQFGLHLIKLEEKKGDQIHARHILLIAKPSEKDLAEARDKADSLYQAIKNGADFGELANQFSEDEESKVQNGDLGWFPVAQLEQVFQDALRDLKVGEYSPPVESRFGLHIFKLVGQKESRKVSLETDWDSIKEMARRYKTNLEIQDWLKELRKTTYVEVKV
ncbi:MAG: PpiC-type peptidyl-prolyl cis-trans isomerase [candidate division Zixibacteria bacterium RBG-1]|nr:MAG: PpiC-type peptidyl-prolyl cis-trans isomerase [candidate division Zixibacteria bacterium RBG-1]OGC86344.1 MAG: hypothetical protein A2V73_02460 [candidate division Zixibacteria bacterium RBG_19FT_COMBO_42_43]